MLVYVPSSTQVTSAHLLCMCIPRCFRVPQTLKMSFVLPVCVSGPSHSLCWSSMCASSCWPMTMEKVKLLTMHLRTLQETRCKEWLTTGLVRLTAFRIALGDVAKSRIRVQHREALSAAHVQHVAVLLLQTLLLSTLSGSSCKVWDYRPNRPAPMCSPNKWSRRHSKSLSLFALLVPLMHPCLLLLLVPGGTFALYATICRACGIPSINAQPLPSDTDISNYHRYATVDSSFIDILKHLCWTPMLYNCWTCAWHGTW